MDKENMLPVGTTLRDGTYKIEEQLSSGGFGNTYIVRNLSFNEVYAMKEFFMKGINLREKEKVTVSVADNKATYESQREKFKKEAQRLRILNNPHIVKVHDLFEDNGTVYYVMDYISGCSLAEKLENTGRPFSENEAIDIFKQMLDALSEIHNQKPQILHLDIKPANIMLNKDGHAFLLDFGSSKQIDANSGVTVSSGITLTKGYAPAELVDGNKELIGPWTDLYELGGTLFKLLTNQQPPSVSEISEEGKNAFSFPNSISKRTRDLVVWLMARSRSKRPKSVDEVLKFLNKDDSSDTLDLNDDDDDDTIIVTSGSSSDDTIITEEKDTDNKRKWYKFAAIVVGVLLVLGIIAFAASNFKQPDINANVTDDSVTTEETPQAKYATNKYFDNPEWGGYLYTGNLDDDGLPVGIGDAVFVKMGKPDGSSYRGTFEAGVLSSTRDAEYKYSNGDVYVGTFANNKFVEGKLTIASTGNYFVGKFYDTTPSEGIWYDKNGRKLKDVGY